MNECYAQKQGKCGIFFYEKQNQKVNFCLECCNFPSFCNSLFGTLPSWNCCCYLEPLWLSGEEDQVSDPHSRTARLHAAKFFPFFFPLLLEKFFIFSPFLNFFCEDWNFYFSLLGEYICEVETFGDPIHQINNLNVLGKYEWFLTASKLWLSAVLEVDKLLFLNFWKIIGNFTYAATYRLLGPRDLACSARGQHWDSLSVLLNFLLENDFDFLKKNWLKQQEKKTFSLTE